MSSYIVNEEKNAKEHLVGIKISTYYIMAGIGVNAGDGQSIVELATRIQRMGLEELRKIPADELRQNVVSGAETGSTKWLSDFNNFYGLANQLKVKSGIQSVDTQIENQVDSDIVAYAESHENDRVHLRNSVATDIITGNDSVGKRVIAVNIIITKYDEGDDKLKRYFEIDVIKDVWWGLHPKDNVGSVPKARFELILNKLRGDLMTSLRGSPLVADQKLIFKTLSKVDSSIANLIQQLTSSNEFLLNTLKPKRSAWSTEISDVKLGALKEDATTIKENFVQTSASPEIANYKEVFVRLTKKYDELFLLIKGINSESPISTDRANLAFNVNRP